MKVNKEKLQVIIKYVVYAVVALVVLSFFFVHSQGKFERSSEAPISDSYITLNDGTIISQDIAGDNIELDAISIMFGTFNRTNEGVLNVSLFQDESEVCQWSVDTATLVDNEYAVFRLEKTLKMESGHHFYITLEEEHQGEDCIVVYTHGDDAQLCYRTSYTDTSLYVKALLVFVAVMAAIVATEMFKVDERIIMTLLLVLVGRVFFWLCPVGMAPDESTHFFRAYEISYGYFVSERVGEEQVGGNILPSELLNYDDEEAEIDWSDTEILTFPNTSLYAPVSYLPQTAGITIARLFTNNVNTIFYAGRLGGFIVSITLCILAIWLIPFGRKIIFIIMMFPMSMQEMISMAPDGFVIGLSMFLLAYVLHLSYGERKLKLLDIFTISLVCLLLSLSKIVYVVLLFVILIIPKDKMGSARKALLIKGGIIGITFALNLIWLSISSSYLIEYYVAGVDSDAQVHYVLTHIFDYYATVVRTTIANSNFFVQTMVGSNLGKFTIDISPIMWIVYTILLIYEVLTSRELPSNIRKYERYVFLFEFLSCVALIYTSLYVQWTPLGQNIIDGIQGRYFIPIVPLLALWTMYYLRERDAKNGNTAVYSSRSSYCFMVIALLNGITAIDMIHYYIG